MKMSKYREILKKCTVSELKKRRKKALENNATELVSELDWELDRRDPRWRNPQSFGRPQPTRARFYDVDLVFPSQIKAYIFLIENFIEVRPDFLERDDPLAERAVCGRAGRYFARSPSELWATSHHLAHHGQYQVLSNGWFANTNLSYPQKLRILNMFSVFAEIPKSFWDFCSIGAYPVSDIRDLLA